jgi:hypothetical protein
MAVSLVGRRQQGGQQSLACRRYHPKKLSVLDEALKPYASSLVGITFEDDPKGAIVVLYPSFTAYDELQAKLAQSVRPLAVALRPLAIRRGLSRVRAPVHGPTLLVLTGRDVNVARNAAGSYRSPSVGCHWRTPLP